MNFQQLNEEKQRTKQNNIPDLSKQNEIKLQINTPQEQITNPRRFLPAFIMLIIFCLHLKTIIFKKSENFPLLNTLTDSGFYSMIDTYGNQWTIYLDLDIFTVYYFRLQVDFPPIIKDNTYMIKEDILNKQYICKSFKAESLIYFPYDAKLENYTDYIHALDREQSTYYMQFKNHKGEMIYINKSSKNSQIIDFKLTTIEGKERVFKRINEFPISSVLASIDNQKCVQSDTTLDFKAMQDKIFPMQIILVHLPLYHSSMLNEYECFIILPQRLCNLFDEDDQKGNNLFQVN